MNHRNDRADGFFVQPPVQACSEFATFGKHEIEQTIPRRFEQQVERHGERTAIRTTHGSLSYAALNREANRLARAILARRGDANEPVAMLLGHGTPAVIAILGILKSGKAYVNLDPSYPESRLSYILDDSQANLVISSNAHLALASTLVGDQARLLSIDDIAPGLSADNVGVNGSPDSLAYILYTSGSTGRPKGVTQNHRNVLHAIMKYTNVLGIGANDRVTLLPSCSTSAAVSDIFAALLNGASLYPFDVIDRGTGDLGDWLIEEGITVYHSVPSVFRHFAADLDDDVRFPALRIVKLGGEPTYKSDFTLFRRSFPSDCLLYVAFGATEIHNISHFFISGETECDDNVLPVGLDFEGTEVLILDEAGAELEPGCTGEIFVKSEYLSPGYWRLPDLTDSVFTTVEGGGKERIYRTGDLGRKRPDGCLEVIGRRDFQVKIRGFRVELGEIEACLRQIAGLEEAVVIARDYGGGNKQLVAYYVTSSSLLDTSKLRQSLREQLPDYMVPSAFVCLDVMPLTPNGKLDRLALPAPDPSHFESALGFVAPRTPMEQLVARIWADALKVERVGVYDDFFEMGGHSLLALRVCLDIEKALGKPVPVAEVLEATTVEQLAQRLGMSSAAPASRITTVPKPVPLQSAGSRPPFFFLSGPHSHFGDRLGPDQPVYRVLYQNLDHSEKPFVRIEDMAAHSLESMTEIQADGPFYLGGHGLGSVVAFEVAHLLRRQGQDVALLVLCECLAPGANRYASDTSSAYRLWQRVGYHFDRARQSGLRPVLSTLLRSAKRKLDTASWPSPAASRNPTRKIYRAAGAEALRRYVPQVYPGRMTYVRSAARAPWRNDDPLNGWGGLAADGVDKYEVPGTHTNIYKEPNVKVLASTLDAVLRKARAETTPKT